MTTEILNTELQEKLMNFFNTVVGTEEFAKIIRRYNHEVSLFMINDR